MRRFIQNGCLLAALFLFVGVFVYAEENPDELREKITEQQSEIQKLDEEIAGYERELTSVSREKNSLQSAVRSLDISRSNVNTKVSKTTKQIVYTEEEIGQLGEDIQAKEAQIGINAEALATALRTMHEQESDTFVELFLRGNTISDIWSDVETLRQFQSVVRVRVGELTSHKQEMEQSKEAAEAKQEDLSAYQSTLAVQKRTLDINREAKNNLLRETKNKESNYQALLAKKRVAREEFEKQLSEYESQLRYVLDPGALPTSGEKALQWPLDKIRITQYFGNTKFAKSGAYNGSGHNGVDFGIPLGTPVKAASSGTIMATGNTDAYRGCLSYGKWVLIKHNNGLATMYAHLSRILVSPGDVVAVGDVIAHSGSTGFSTGPHLHFSVYAATGVQVVRLGDIRKSTYCSNANIPIAPWKAYLNPLSYL